ncbi:hypothetical protein Gasu2_32590 [Galdieria sulphuraria]|nr:hypothetical protein Gasu2_32590 [Galdieria sulphuraria]
MKSSCVCFVADIFSSRQSFVFLSNKCIPSSGSHLGRKGKQRKPVIIAESSLFDFHNKSVEVDSVQFGLFRSRLTDVCKFCESLDQDKLVDLQRQLNTICNDFEKLDELYHQLYEKYEQVTQHNEQLIKQVDALQRKVKELESDIVYFRGEY